MKQSTPDMIERFPDAGEPAEEREYTISAVVPVIVELKAYGTDEEEAIKDMKEDLKNIDIRPHIIDWDASEADDFEVEV